MSNLLLTIDVHGALRIICEACRQDLTKEPPHWAVLEQCPHCKEKLLHIKDERKI